MPKINVYVSEDLRRRMDKAKDVNWSRAASQAFEAELAEIAARKVRKNMDDIVTRLRVSKQECETQDEKRGRDAGERWARNMAEWDELERVVDFADKMSPYEENPNVRQLYSVITDESDPENWDRDSFVELCELWWHSQNPTGEFLWGFCNGATTVYNAVVNEV